MIRLEFEIHTIVQQVGVVMLVDGGTITVPA